MFMELALTVFCLLVTSEMVLGTPKTKRTPEYYTAAVFEHARLGNRTLDTPLQLIRKNLDMYERATELAAEKGADIIVFPEYGIFPPNSRIGLKKYLEYTPDPRNQFSNPCEQRHKFSKRPILHTLSCMAKRHDMVVVANMGDIQPCKEKYDSNCPKDGVYHFNTNVAFDRRGTLISRYHKEHLYFERGMDVPHEDQNSVFMTDFGSFAMFVCFDVVFGNITKAARIADNVVLSTMWVDQMPLMNAVQVWQGWALGNNVTFLAANVQSPGEGAVGSGIFSGHTGVIKYSYNPDGLSKLIVSRVPRSKYYSGEFLNPDSGITVITSNETYNYDEADDGKDVPEKCSSIALGTSQKHLTDYRCYYEDAVNYTFVKLTQRADVLRACSNGMCCSLNYSALSMEENFYLGVYNGTYNVFNRYFWCKENCLVVRCDPKNNKPCSIFPMKSNTVFERLELKSNFTTSYVYPSVILSSMRLAPSTEWSHPIQGHGDRSVNGGIIYHNRSQKPLLVAGLNGRCYERDPPYKR